MLAWARFLSSTLLPFLVWIGVSVLRLSIRKKGTLIIKGLLRNLDVSMGVVRNCRHLRPPEFTGAVVTRYHNKFRKIASNHQSTRCLSNGKQRHPRRCNSRSRAYGSRCTNNRFPSMRALSGIYKAYYQCLAA